MFKILISLGITQKHITTVQKSNQETVHLLHSYTFQNLLLSQELQTQNLWRLTQSFAFDLLISPKLNYVFFRAVPMARCSQQQTPQGHTYASPSQTYRNQKMSGFILQTSSYRLKPRVGLTATNFKILLSALVHMLLFQIRAKVFPFL